MPSRANRIDDSSLVFCAALSPRLLSAVPLFSLPRNNSHSARTANLKTMRFFVLCGLILALSRTNGTHAFIHPAPAAAGVNIRVAKKTAPCNGTPFFPALMVKRDEDENVKVNLIDDVDAVTITTIGFGLIAFNFLVLANVS